MGQCTQWNKREAEKINSNNKKIENVENTNLTTEQVVEKLDNLFTEKMENVPTHEDITSLKSELDSVKSLEAKSQELEKTIAKFEGRLEAMSEKAVQKKESSPKSIGEAITKTYSDNLERIKEAVEKGGKVNLDVKTTTIGADYTGDYALTDFDSEVDRVVRKREGILDAVNRGTTSSKFVTYVTQGKDTSEAPAWTREGEAKMEAEPSWEEISEEVKKIASYVKVSKEMLEDLSFIRGEINQDLIAQLNEGIEDAMLNGAGASSINGLLNSGLPNFNAGAFAGQVPSANISDVLRVAKGQIESANFTPTHVILNPADITALQLTKGTDGTYTYPMYIPMDGSMVVAEMKVVSSTFIAQNTYIVGDMSKVNVRFRNNVGLSVGLDSDDFTKNMITILAEARLVQYIKNNQKNAFVTGVLSTDIATLTPAP